MRPLSLERGTGSSALPQLAAGVPADETEVGDPRSDGFELRPIDRSVGRELRAPGPPPQHGNGRPSRRFLRARLRSEHEIVLFGEVDPGPCAVLACGKV